MDLLGIHLYLHENTNNEVSIFDLHKPYLTYHDYAACECMTRCAEHAERPLNKN